MQRFRGLFVSGAALILLVSPPVAGAEQNPSASSSTQASSSAPQDFMLGRPRVTFGARGSFLVASAKSDIFDFITEQLSVEKSDFNTGSFGAEVGYNLTERLTISGSVDLNNMNESSDYRLKEELLPNGSRVPIQQTTELEQTNFTASIKFAVLPRGRSVGRLAWIPRTIVPYVGAGAGYGSYSLRQNGDFVDFVDDHIFTDTFHSDGWAPTAHVLGGADIQVFRHVIFSFEGRYSWQHADLENDFIDFEPIDLGGFRFGAGIHFAF